jgi:hypothetical protein
MICDCKLEIGDCKISNWSFGHPTLRAGPRPKGGDSEGETGNPPVGWESEGQVSGQMKVSAFMFFFPDT